MVIRALAQMDFELLSFSMPVLSLVLRVLYIPPMQSWDDEVRWTVLKLSAVTEEAEAGRIIWQSWVSNVWRERCRRMYAG
ncbi:unnamed protein product, partial [Linum tenue]